MKQTARNRVAFTMLYNKKTSRVMELTGRGLSAKEIENRTGIPSASVAAIKANVTRYIYAPFVYPSISGKKLEGICHY